MTVLTLAGKPINWAKPPSPTTKVIWSQKTTGGKTITGSLRTIAHLDHLNTLAIKKFGKGITVFQGPYNTTVPASAGTHDYDACLDVWISGVDGYVQQGFFRANGGGAYYRTPAQGFSPHIHYFTLPIREGVSVADDYKVAGFKVGKYVDGGYSTSGGKFFSAQIEDYYAHRNALAGHAPDTTWFPADIGKTIFNLDAYIARQIPKATMLSVMTANVGSKHKIPELAPVVAQRKPHIVIVTEAYYAKADLKAIPGYRLYQISRKVSPEAPDIAVLVRRGVKIKKRSVLKMTKTWVSPKGKTRNGRYYPALRLVVDGSRWRVLGVHFPTRNNAVAQVESQMGVNKWLTGSAMRSVVAGDFNQMAPVVESWAKASVAPGTKVDHAIYARSTHERTTRLKQPEGMHGWLLYIFNTNKKG